MLRLELAVKSNQGELETDLSGNMCKNTKIIVIVETRRPIYCIGHILEARVLTIDLETKKKSLIKW